LSQPLPLPNHSGEILPPSAVWFPELFYLVFIFHSQKLYWKSSNTKVQWQETKHERCVEINFA
jgi:hypothetical protein